MYKSLYAVLTLLFALTFCVGSAIPTTERIVGNPQDVVTNSESGTMLLGGGFVDEAIKWMIQKSGGGDFVILSATPKKTDYEHIIYNMGGVDSVEIICVDSRELANSKYVVDKVMKAEAVLILGGDQNDYVNYWQGTKLAEAVDYVRNIKGVPIGGISAGLAILGEYYYSAANDSVVSNEAMLNPFNEKVTLGSALLKMPFLKNIITDTHYGERGRQGRHITFLARLINSCASIRGIGVDLDTALCVDKNGVATVFGEGKAYFLTPNRPPEVCEPGKPLSWVVNKAAVTVHILNQKQTFLLNEWKAINSIIEAWYVDQGVFYSNAIINTEIASATGG